MAGLITWFYAFIRFYLVQIRGVMHFGFKAEILNMRNPFFTATASSTFIDIQRDYFAGN